MKHIGRGHNAEVAALLSTQLALYMVIFALGSVQDIPEFSLSLCLQGSLLTSTPDS